MLPEVIRTQQLEALSARCTVGRKEASNAWASDLVAAPTRVRLAQAQFVALGYDLGDRFVSESEGLAVLEVLSEDRKALCAIRDLIEKWGRYVITDRLFEKLRSAVEAVSKQP